VSWRRKKPGCSTYNFVGTEHILLGLIHEGQGVAARALQSLGISLEAVRQQVEQIIGRGQKAPSGTRAFGLSLAATCRLAARQSRQPAHWRRSGCPHLDGRRMGNALRRRCRHATASEQQPMRDRRQIRMFTTSAIVDKYATSPDHADGATSITRCGATW
jgi:ATP-dependent Clp protease ATP-binding subunit ClpA